MAVSMRLGCFVYVDKFALSAERAIATRAYAEVLRREHRARWLAAALASSMGLPLHSTLRIHDTTNHEEGMADMSQSGRHGLNCRQNIPASGDKQPEPFKN